MKVAGLPSMHDYHASREIGKVISDQIESVAERLISGGS
jgi:hypothetical protein